MYIPIPQEESTMPCISATLGLARAAPPHHHNTPQGDDSDDGEPEGKDDSDL